MRQRSDEGAATVLALSLVGLLLAVALALVLASGLVIAHRRAQSAADLAALAGAAQVATGSCAWAARVARANGAALSDCVVEGLTVRVGTRVAIRLLGRTWVLPARARAGPAG